MDIYQSLLSLLPKEPVAVSQVIVGVHWTLVCSKFCGLASTITNCGPHGHSRMRDVGKLNQKSAQELAGWITSDNFLEASVAMAAINSLITVDEQKLERINASEIVTREGHHKNVVIVGHFPFVEEIKNKTKNCWVIEKRPFEDDFPQEAAVQFIPQADIVAITGTAFINHTMENLLSLCDPQSKILILGPSTPLTTLLFNRGISFLSGARVDRPTAAVNTIIEGACLPQVDGIRLVSMVNPMEKDIGGKTFGSTNR